MSYESVRVDQPPETGASGAGPLCTRRDETVGTLHGEVANVADIGEGFVGV